MTRRALLVTGSRALALTTAARRWAEDILRQAFAWWRPGLLMHGRCLDSPDVWSSDIVLADAELRDTVAIRAFLVDGSIEPHGTLGWTSVGFAGTRWTSPEHVAAHPLRRRPLLRNQGMIDALSLEVEVNEVEVLVVGLGAHWSQTDGTGHTVRLAEKTKRMRVEHRMCPEEFAP